MSGSQTIHQGLSDNVYFPCSKIKHTVGNENLEMFPISQKTLIFSKIDMQVVSHGLWGLMLCL